MPSTFFPDTTVLINFGLIDRLDLLGLMLPARSWCITVARECRQSYEIEGFSTYSTVKTLFGAALIPSGGERLNAQKMRNDMAKPTDKPDAHMGEAETIAIIRNRPLGTPVFITDDVKATKLAKQEGLTTLNTWTLFRVAARNQGVAFTEQEAWQAALILRQNKRGWPKGIGPSHDDFIAWLRQT